MIVRLNQKGCSPSERGFYWLTRDHQVTRVVVERMGVTLQSLTHLEFENGFGSVLDDAKHKPQNECLQFSQNIV